MHNLSDISVITFPRFERVPGELFVYEQFNGVPFDIKRAFVIKAKEATGRGSHAHKECAQLMIALAGTCIVMCDDGRSKSSTILNKGSEGLFVPPTIWAEQYYEPDTILLVLTDMLYCAEDYIRDYDEFLVFRATGDIL
ncbi:MAG: FdtA/QdtA family cupin domain-containing protein [Holosporales bacterium]|jgi:dTDP-4-dehydrorhamnose 3,5-epimerase-like enzyme|nr:FdtA/QdtA family cupin domain-containing protein [Holosporales bacterium]